MNTFLNSIGRTIRQSIKTIGRALTVLVLTAGIWTQVAAPPSARAQADTKGPNLYQGVSGLPTPMTAGVKSNLTSAAITATRVALKPGSGLAFQATFLPASSSTANLTWEIGLSCDGTNYMASSPLVVVTPCRGTVGCLYFTNWPAATFEGARFASLLLVSNATAVSVTITNAGLSVPNIK